MVFNIVFICENNDRLIFAAESIWWRFLPTYFFHFSRENHAMIKNKLDQNNQREPDVTAIVNVSENCFASKNDSDSAGAFS